MSRGFAGVRYHDRSRVIAQPSQLPGVFSKKQAESRGQPFGINKTFPGVLVVETYPLGRRGGFWHSAREHVSAQQPAEEGWEGTSLLPRGGEPATEFRGSRTAASVASGRHQR